MRTNRDNSEESGEGVLTRLRWITLPQQHRHPHGSYMAVPPLLRELLYVSKPRSIDIADKGIFPDE